MYFTKAETEKPGHYAKFKAPSLIHTTINHCQFFLFHWFSGDFEIRGHGYLGTLELLPNITPEI